MIFKKSVTTLLLIQLTSLTAFADDTKPVQASNESHKSASPKVCTPDSKDPECQISIEAELPEDDTEPAHDHFYGNVSFSCEHAFGESGCGKKLFYNGAYRMVDKKTGRQYDFMRFENEIALPFNERNDLTGKMMNFTDYINDFKIYQTQTFNKAGKLPGDDDALTKRSTFYGEFLDENDYGRGLHYFVAIPVGWDRTWVKQLGKNVTVESENELGVGGYAYAGTFREDGSQDPHHGVNLVRMVNSVSFEYAKGDNSLSFTPIEFTNSVSTFKQGINREWEASAQLDYENDKSGLGVQVEVAHKSGLSLFPNQTANENIVRVGVSADPVKLVQKIVKFRFFKKLFHRRKRED